MKGRLLWHFEFYIKVMAISGAFQGIGESTGVESGDG